MFMSLVDLWVGLGSVRFGRVESLFHFSMDWVILGQICRKCHIFTQVKTSSQTNQYFLGSFKILLCEKH